jgi:hypothetical protein
MGINRYFLGLLSSARLRVASKCETPGTEKFDAIGLVHGVMELR